MRHYKGIKLPLLPTGINKEYGIEYEKAFAVIASEWPLLGPLFHFLLLKIGIYI